jgi:hypothetical protein
VVVPFGHTQEMKKETLWKKILQKKEGNRHTSLSPIRNTGHRKTENGRKGYSGN